MKSVLLGCLAAVLLALVASQVLEIWQEPSATAYSTEGVRLGASDEFTDRTQ